MKKSKTQTKKKTHAKRSKGRQNEKVNLTVYLTSKAKNKWIQYANKRSCSISELLENTAKTFK